ncbi:MAG: RHS repeat-associated core domain-containing protein, partial [Vulcanimicrobiaceae bacterium]
ISSKFLSGTGNINPCRSTNTAVRMPTSVEWWASPGFLGTVSANVGTGGVVGMARTDGIDDGLDVIQGVRSYDAQAGIWTSPDAYAGTVNDPGTQKSYMWNNNNPISYSDPSGYDPTAELLVGIAGEGVCVAAEPCGIIEGVLAVIFGGAAAVLMAGKSGNHGKGIESDRDRIREHQEKLKKEPNADSARHWREEIRASRANIDKAYRQLDKNKKKKRTEKNTRPPDDPGDGEGGGSKDTQR